MPLLSIVEGLSTVPVEGATHVGQTNEEKPVHAEFIEVCTGKHTNYNSKKPTPIAQSKDDI